MFLKDVTIQINQKVSDSYYKLSFKESQMAKFVRTGKFLEIKVGNGIENLLRIPISINNLEGDVISIIYKIIGKGTKRLSEYKKGEKINILGPLGNSFPFIHKDQEVLIVAGGVGCGPFSIITTKMNNWKLFYGCQNKNEIALPEALFQENKEKVFFATDDGSLGYHGYIPDVLEDFLEKEKIQKKTIIFSCGPNIMMKKIYEIAKKYNIPSYFSLEEYMACGIGACAGCAVKIVNEEKKNGWEYKKVCTDGPVFNGDDIIW